MESVVLNKVVCILGDRGSFKSCFATSLAYSYSKNNISIFTNMEFKGINHTRITFKDIKDFPDFLHDGVIILDEMQVGADSYNFLSKDVQGITQFITQIRKRNLSFIYITQNFTTIVKRLRMQTDYLYIMKKQPKPDYADIMIYDLKSNNKLINQITGFYGRPFYSFYNTNQLIQ